MNIAEIRNRITSLNDLGCKAKYRAGGVEKDYYNKIGNVLVLFQDIEDLLKKNIIIRLSNVSDIHLSGILEELSFKALIRSLQSIVLKNEEGLLHEYKERFDNKFEELIKQTYKIEETRNRFTHSTWIGGKDSMSATTIKSSNYKKGFKTSWNDLNVDDFDVIILWMDTILSGYKDLWYQFGANIVYSVGENTRHPIDKTNDIMDNIEKKNIKK